MKKYSALLAIIIFSLQSFAQLSITPGAQWINSGAVTVTLNDMSFDNNGSFAPGSSAVKFTGNANKTIGGTAAIVFNELEIAKTANNKMSLLSNVVVNTRVNFISGLIDLNQKTLSLASTAYLNNESEASRIIGPTGGETIITVNENAPNAVNAGNLGAVITSAANLGAVTIKRGHQMQAGSGLTSSINRYFDIQPANNAGLNATLKFLYFDAELGQQNENTMIMFRSTDNGASWANQSIDTRNTALNYVEKAGIPAFSRWALSSAGTGPLPVIDLQFYAKRISNSKVQLDWKTSQEINNLGFNIERKKENENDFNNIGFINSSAPGGNSGFPLSYSKLDDNAFTGKTFYRLKQQDIDGHFVYSVTRVVNGDVNKSVTLKAWPIPAVTNVSVIVDGIEKDVLLVFDATGRLVKQTDISNQVPVKLSSLAAGNYIIRLAGQKDISQKIIIQ